MRAPVSRASVRMVATAMVSATTGIAARPSARVGWASALSDAWRPHDTAYRILYPRLERCLVFEAWFRQSRRDIAQSEAHDQSLGFVHAIGVPSRGCRIACSDLAGGDIE